MSEEERPQAQPTDTDPNNAAYTDDLEAELHAAAGNDSDDHASDGDTGVINNNRTDGYDGGHPGNDDYADGDYANDGYPDGSYADGGENADQAGPYAVQQRRRPWLTAVAVLVPTILIAALAMTLVYMWQYHWRPITVRVDGIGMSVNVDTTVQTLLDDHDGFRRKPGRLLAVDGTVLDQDGGRPIAVTLNGRPVKPERYADTLVGDQAKLTTDNGKDTTEPYDAVKTPIPHGTDIDILGGGIQIVTQRGRDGIKETRTGRRSHQKATVVTVKPQDFTVRGINPNPDGRKVIALTFDDGPSEYTAKMLDILKSRSAKATFFDVGEGSDAMPDLERRMLADGHQVANHSYDHPYMPSLSRADLRDNITRGFASIKTATGKQTRVLRSPYGAFGEQQWKDAGDLIDMNVLWDIDTLDWKRPGADAIRKAVLDNATNGSIVLMHDGGGDRSQDIDALPGILDGLKKQGFTFVTIDELVEMSGQKLPSDGDGAADGDGATGDGASSDDAAEPGDESDGDAA